MTKKDKGKGKSKPPPPAAADDTAAQRRVALLRHKLTKAMDDPLMRDQIVKAIRSMMIEGK
ncbi:MAG: hypothetical protein AB7H70_08095 [Rhodospirillaceae bacterium]